MAEQVGHGLEADVWSLGCMLYTMLVGQPPFDTDAVKSTLDRVIKAKYDLPPHLSPEAQDLIQRLLQKNPEHRLRLGGETCVLACQLRLLYFYLWQSRCLLIFFPRTH